VLQKLRLNIYALKQRERLEREGVLLDEFSDAIAYLNQTLPSEDQIRYIAFDMSKATKRYKAFNHSIKQISDHCQSFP